MYGSSTPPVSAATSGFDVVIVGAGINGAGIARDATLRGLKVLLLDKGDVGSGTSSWSTRLIHGGLRYLEHGELGLVRESLRERETLLRTAPHLVKPLPIIVPIYKNARRGRATIRTGLFAYDLLSFDRSLRRHRMLAVSEAIEKAPALNQEGLKGAALFYDAQVEFPERLVVENVLAAREAGASLATYARVTRLLVESQRITGVEFATLDGVHTVSAHYVVNAAGPWIDSLLDDLDVHDKRLIGGTKGSHIVVRSFPGITSSAVYVEAQSDGRPFFIIPWNGNVLIGTTDIRFEGNPDFVKTEASEVNYLLAEANRVLPAAKLTRKQILFTYSGVRPLPFTHEKDEQKITRRHFIREHPRLINLVSIVGGKLTTYRHLAEECVDQILETLGRLASPSKTAELRLPGADYDGDVIEGGDALQKRLIRVYGSRSKEILELASADRRLAHSLNSAGDAIAAEVVYSFEGEFATTLVDCLLRRTMLGLNADLGIGIDERAARVAQEFLGWSDERVDEEVKRYRSEMARFRLSAELET